MQRQQGFSLIELMVTLAIIGIISSIAIPGYNRYVLKSERKTNGMPTLLDTMRAQENYFINNLIYADTLGKLGFSSPYMSKGGKYKITTAKCLDDDGAELDWTACVNLIASPQDGQVKDGELTIDSKGVRTHKGVNGWLK